MPGPVIYLVRSWPRLSQTFILDELLAVERRGLEVALFSLVPSGETIVQSRVAAVHAPVTYLAEPLPPLRRRVAAQLRVASRYPRRYLRTWWYARSRPSLSAGYSTCSTRRCFGHAVQVAAAVLDMNRAARPPSHIHAHFAHDPALVALLVHRLTGLPYSLTAHARDLYQIPGTSLAARTEYATAIVTCCAVNAEYIAATVPAQQRAPVHVLHHGLELDRFVPSPSPARSTPPVLLSVGRLVAKKGFDVMFEALAQLKRDGILFELRLYGDGPLRAELAAQCAELGIEENVRMLGECSQEQVRDALAEADVFVLTPRVTPDGDRDGIPNVLVEAMACGLPVVTTSAGGVTELVRHGINGLVSRPGDVAGIASHIRELLNNPSLGQDLATAARRTVEADYDVNTAAAALERLFRQAAVQSGVAPVGAT
ncbi:MAG TPA: glycosyltransferase family 4 protein [Propionibacteriaceae bacterium]|nr:glycosyltransferase family 4 protein [Propionibacteriaceae bacterium]